MSRTPEQIAADDALTEAIHRVHTAYEDHAASGVITKYLVVTEFVSFTSAGGQSNATSTYGKDGGMSIVEGLGLAEYAAHRFRQSIPSD